VGHINQKIPHIATFDLFQLYQITPIKRAKNPVRFCRCMLAISCGNFSYFCRHYYFFFFQARVVWVPPNMRKDAGDNGWVPTTAMTTRRLRGNEIVSHDGHDASGGGGGTSQQNLSAFVFLIAASATFMLLFVIFYREYYWRKHGVDTCSGYGRCRSRRQRQVDRERAIGDEVQQRRNQERDEEHTLLCNERRLWYESYIKTFTMVSHCM